jgi:hypothetical protein
MGIIYLRRLAQGQSLALGHQLVLALGHRQLAHQLGLALGHRLVAQGQGLASLAQGLVALGHRLVQGRSLVLLR